MTARDAVEPPRHRRGLSIRESIAAAGSIGVSGGHVRGARARPSYSAPNESEGIVRKRRYSVAACNGPASSSDMRQTANRQIDAPLLLQLMPRDAQALPPWSHRRHRGDPSTSCRWTRVDAWTTSPTRRYSRRLLPPDGSGARRIGSPEYLRPRARAAETSA